MKAEPSQLIPRKLAET